MGMGAAIGGATGAIGGAIQTKMQAAQARHDYWDSFTGSAEYPDDGKIIQHGNLLYKIDANGNAILIGKVSGVTNNPTTADVVSGYGGVMTIMQAGVAVAGTVPGKDFTGWMNRLSKIGKFGGVVGNIASFGLTVKDIYNTNQITWADALTTAGLVVGAAGVISASTPILAGGLIIGFGQLIFNGFLEEKVLYDLKGMSIHRTNFIK